MATLQKTGVDTVAVTETLGHGNVDGLTDVGITYAITPLEASDSSPIVTEAANIFEAGDEVNFDSPITVTVNTPFITCELSTDTDSLIDI